MYGAGTSLSVQCYQSSPVPCPYCAGTRQSEQCYQPSPVPYCAGARQSEQCYQPSPVLYCAGTRQRAMLSTFSSTMPILCWYQASTGIIRENVKNTAHSSWYWYCTFFGTVHSLQIFMQSNITAKIHLMACILGACILQLTSPVTERHVVKFHDITAS